MSEYGPGPHVAVDAVVFYRNRKLNKFFVLVIQRQDGTIAVPGGFVDPQLDDSLEHAVSRELIEETALEVFHNEWVDLPARTNKNRDSRSWVISFPFTFDLGDYDVEPNVQAGDDAKQAFWLEVGSEVNWFIDHKEIVNSAITNLFLK